MQGHKKKVPFVPGLQPPVVIAGSMIEQLKTIKTDVLFGQKSLITLKPLLFSLLKTMPVQNK